MEFDAQLEQFINGHLFRLLAGLGATKAVEAWVTAFIDPLIGEITFWVGVMILSLFIAAKSPEIEA